jgi:hypothetical protein
MALSFVRYSATVDNSVLVATIDSPTLTLAPNDVIVALIICDDNTGPGSLSIANSGSALSWTNIATTNTNNNCKVAGWWAVCSDSTSRTVTITQGAGTTNVTRQLHCLVHTGALTSDPVPAGNVFSGVGATDVSQSITPTSSGSMLWMTAGDWGQTNSYAAIANCTLEDTFDDTGRMTAVLVRPTTQPRADALAFTIGETDTSGTLAWLAFEVQKAPDAPTIDTQPANQTVYAGQTASFTISATTSGGTLHYQWKDDGSNVGTDSSTYAPTVALSDSGSIITCVVTDDNGSATSADALLTVLPTASVAWIRA